MEKDLLLKQMQLSRDKNLFYDCSSELKNDFDFVTEVMKIFKDDFDFIDEIAEDFYRGVSVDDIQNSREFLELSILLGQFVPEGHPYYELYTSRLNGIYNTYLMNVAIFKRQEMKISELGFSMLVSQYGDRANVLDYFASRMMYEIYHKNPNGTFEDLIHAGFDEFYYIEEEGYEEFFIRNLTSVDYELGNYLASREDLLEDMVDELTFVGDNWETYNEELLFLSVEIVNNWLDKCTLEQTYGDILYSEEFKKVILSKRLGKVFGISKDDVSRERSNVVDFNAHLFKNELKKLIDKVFVEGQTLTQLQALVNPEDDKSKKLT